MKTELLAELGLSEEQIKQVFAENGKDIKAEKDKALALEASLTTARQDLDDYREKLKAFDGVDVAKLQGEIKTLQDTIADREKTEKQAQEEKALTDNIVAAFGDKAFTSDYVKNGLIADIKAQLADKTNAGKG